MIRLLIILQLIYMSIYDILYLEVKNIHLEILITLHITYIICNYSIEKMLSSFLFALLVLTFFITMYIFFKDKFGGGDIKVLVVVSLILRENIIYLIFISSIIGIISMIFLKKKKIAFLPCITAAYILMYI